MVSKYINWSVLRKSVNNSKMVSRFCETSRKKIQFLSAKKRKLVSNKFSLSVEKYFFISENYTELQQRKFHY